ncbi:50S ribosomal protein L33, partial [Streptomyces albidoflavus]
LHVPARPQRPAARPDRISLRKFDPVAGRHVEFREER